MKNVYKLWKNNLGGWGITGLNADCDKKKTVLQMNETASLKSEGKEVLN